MGVTFDTREDRCLWPASGDVIEAAKLKTRSGRSILRCGDFSLVF